MPTPTAKPRAPPGASYVWRLQGQNSRRLPGQSRSKSVRVSQPKHAHRSKQHGNLQEHQVEKDASTGDLWLVQHPNPNVHRPMSEDAELSIQLAHSFDNLDLQRAWFAYVPCYVGEHRAVDSAAKAVILAWRNRSQDPVAGMKHYAMAIQELRSSLDSSDISLLCVALMANFETVMTATPEPMYQHIQGLSAIIKARPKGFHTSEVARAVLYTFVDELFRLACYNNTPHPLDNPRHRNLEPPSRTTSRDEAVLSLRRSGFRLFVRLPRLISGFRAWQEQIARGEIVHVPEAVLVLARELLDIRNQEAEDQLLHRIEVVKTQDEETRKLMAYSFGFNYLSEVDAIGLYWEARLLTVSLCVRIRTLEECVQFSSGSPPRQKPEPSADYVNAKEEKQSCLANLVMAWQYTLTTPILAKDAIQALVIKWGAVADNEKFRQHSAESIRHWILQQAHTIDRGKFSIPIDAEFMDKESAILFGSPVRQQNSGDLPVRPSRDR